MLKAARYFSAGTAVHYHVSAARVRSCFPGIAIYLSILLLICPSSFVRAEGSYRVIDSSYTVCNTQAHYRQLLSWSLYGVGTPPDSGCFPAPANAKAVIRQCPEDDIMVCQFRLTPEDGSPAFDAWASKVMLRPDK